MSCMRHKAEKPSGGHLWTSGKAFVAPPLNRLESHFQTFSTRAAQACQLASRLQIAEGFRLLLGRRRSLLFRDGVIDDNLLHALIGDDLG
jgi:hypothetical protein